MGSIPEDTDLVECNTAQGQAVRGVDTRLASTVSKRASPTAHRSAEREVQLVSRVLWLLARIQRSQAIDQLGSATASSGITDPKLTELQLVQPMGVLLAVSAAMRLEQGAYLSAPRRSQGPLHSAASTQDRTLVR